MDSRNIYIAAHHLMDEIECLDWIHVGLGDYFDHEKVVSHARLLFVEPEVHVVCGRQDSYTTTLDLALESVKKLLNEGEVSICDTAFRKMIQFDPVGVMCISDKDA